jgi:hypothetical protein
VSPVKYKLGFISQKSAVFIATAVKISELSQDIDLVGEAVVSLPRLQEHATHLRSYSGASCTPHSNFFEIPFCLIISTHLHLGRMSSAYACVSKVIQGPPRIMSP